MVIAGKCEPIFKSGNIYIYIFKLGLLIFPAITIVRNYQRVSGEVGVGKVDFPPPPKKVVLVVVSNNLWNFHPESNILWNFHLENWGKIQDEPYFDNI